MIAGDIVLIVFVVVVVGAIIAWAVHAGRESDASYTHMEWAKRQHNKRLKQSHADKRAERQAFHDSRARIIELRLDVAHAEARIASLEQDRPHMLESGQYEEWRKANNQLQADFHVAKKELKVAEFWSGPDNTDYQSSPKYDASCGIDCSIAQVAPA